MLKETWQSFINIKIFMKQIRATELEKFMTCHYKYKFDAPRDGSWIFFDFWTALHKYIETRLKTPDNKEALDLILKPWAVKYREQIMLMSNVFLEEFEKRWLTLVIDELKLNNTFTEHEIYLEGTPDLLCRNPQWEYLILDIKTASAERPDDQQKGVKQCKIYPALFKMWHDINVKYFEYWVMKKISIPTLKIYTYETTEDVHVNELGERVQEFRKCMDEEIRMPSYPNYQCKWCKLRSACFEYKKAFEEVPLPIEQTDG